MLNSKLCSICLESGNKATLESTLERITLTDLSMGNFLDRLKQSCFKSLFCEEALQLTLLPNQQAPVEFLRSTTAH